MCHVSAPVKASESEKNQSGNRHTALCSHARVFELTQRLERQQNAAFRNLASQASHSLRGSPKSSSSSKRATGESQARRHDSPLPWCRPVSQPHTERRLQVVNPATACHRSPHHQVTSPPPDQTISNNGSCYPSSAKERWYLHAHTKHNKAPAKLRVYDYAEHANGYIRGVVKRSSTSPVGEYLLWIDGRIASHHQRTAEAEQQYSTIDMIPAAAHIPSMQYIDRRHDEMKQVDGQHTGRDAKLV